MKKNDLFSTSNRSIISDNAITILVHNVRSLSKYTYHTPYQYTNLPIQYTNTPYDTRTVGIIPLIKAKPNFFKNFPQS